jgi:predicted RNA binding protein YcfA (HicA-like mRNA interferase family)
LKAVTGGEMCRALERQGWQRCRTTGSHRIYIYKKAGDPKTISVPVHAGKTLKPGLQRRIMKDAGLTEADL